MRRFSLFLLLGWMVVQFPSSAWLGVSIQDLTPQMAARLGIRDQKGVFVASVQFGSPAKEGGIEQGDVIISFDGEKLSEAADLVREMSRKVPGDQVELTLIRNQRRLKLKVLLGSPPREAI
ncbi:MAG: PDZ domain-containing protein [Nitrospira sp.]|nr:PDZ domain-containing protein [Candidatus Manganitrophaceae bacterium]HIL34686.1 PDZ domain-containing protein [Candidatus Manganitrophaceae bacterium]